jgi:hypothetical protein
LQKALSLGTNNRSNSQERKNNTVRPNSPFRQGNPNNLSDFQNRGRSPSPYSCDRRDISRDRSLEYKRSEQRAYNSYPKMKKGYNCSPGYNPIINKKMFKMFKH